MDGEVFLLVTTVAGISDEARRGHAMDVVQNARCFDFTFIDEALRSAWAQVEKVARYLPGDAEEVFQTFLEE